MAISGLVSGGFNAALDDVNDRRLRELVRQLQEKQQADQLALQRDQLASVNTDREAMRDNTRRQIDLSELTRRDRNNERGLELMKEDRQAMDVDAAVSSLPAHLKPIGGLFKIGAVRGFTPEDMEAPEARAARAAAAREQTVQDQIRVRTATRQPQQSRERRPEWVRQADGSVIDLNGVAPPGTKPYDAVAERSSKPVDNGEAADTAREAKRIATALKDHKGFKGAFGVMDSVLPTVRQDTADAESLRDALTSLLTLENMGKMKGVLSDSDMKVLKQASSTINARMSEGAARAELARIIEVMGKVGGEAPTVDTKATNADTALADLVYDPATKSFKPKGKP